MRSQPVAFDELAEPVDLVAVQADDELINALAAGMSVSAPGVGGYDADDRVAAILAAWKADVDADPMPELVDVDTAVSTVVAARSPSGRTRHLVPVAAAAAFLVLAVGGLSVTSYNAQPEDVLPQEGQGELAEAQDFLEAKAAETPEGQPVNPASPLATQPSREVPESVRESQPSSPEDTSTATSTTDPTSSATSEGEPGPEA